MHANKRNGIRLRRQLAWVICRLIPILSFVLQFIALLLQLRGK